MTTIQRDNITLNKMLNKPPYNIVSRNTENMMITNPDNITRCMLDKFSIAYYYQFVNKYDFIIIYRVPLSDKQTISLVEKIVVTNTELDN